MRGRVLPVVAIVILGATQILVQAAMKQREPHPDRHLIYSQRELQNKTEIVCDYCLKGEIYPGAMISPIEMCDKSGGQNSDQGLLE